MKLYVAELGSNRDPHIVEYPGATEHHRLESILYIPIPRRISVQELDSQLKAVQSQWLRAGQLVVLRLHPPAAGELLGDEVAIANLEHRLEGQPVAAAHLAPDRSLKLTSVVQSRGTLAYDEEHVLRAIRFAELHSWLDQPGVVLPPNDDFQYEGPNGCRYESFMRVGTAIQGMETLDAVSFWLQPYLTKRAVVVLDAWTINSVALNLSRYADQCGSPCEATADIECLGAYDESLEKLKRRLEAALDRAEPSAPALLISSVVSGAKLHRRLETLLHDVGFEEVHSVALYGRADSPGEIFCRPASVGRYWQKDDPKCPTGPTVQIAASTYLVEVAIEPNLERIREEHVQQARDFFESYGGMDFLTVHRDEPVEERHHMIHLDVERLMTASRFSERLDQELKELGSVSPDLILAPTHAPARALAEEVACRLGVELLLADESLLRHLPEEQKGQLRDAADILIVDDVVISGSRLMGYRNFLRRCGFLEGENPPRIHLLAGVARVPDILTIAGIEDMLDDRRLRRVETLLLPDWGKAECPWCWELEQLEAVGRSMPRTEKLEKRWKALHEVGQGLRDSLYVPWMSEGSDTLPVAVWKLGPNSIFRAQSEIDLFVGVASAVQSLRAAGGLRERQMFPLGYALDPRFWISGRYYDSAIVAAILRATRRHDIRTTQIEPGLLKGMSQRLKNRDDLRGEMVMAMARSHLPIHPEVSGNGGLLDDPSADPGLLELMRNAFERPAASRPGPASVRPAESETGVGSS
jgi:hypothetical protein